MRSNCIPLVAAPRGQEVRIRSVQDTVAGQGQRLRELGLLEGRTVRVVSMQDPLICVVGECRFGLCHRLASCVVVEPTSSEPRG